MHVLFVGIKLELIYKNDVKHNSISANKSPKRNFSATKNKLPASINNKK